MQAENGDICFCQERPFGLRVLATVVIDAERLHAVQLSQSLADLKSGGARFAVDENLDHTCSAGLGSALPGGGMSCNFDESYALRHMIQCALVRQTP